MNVQSVNESSFSTEQIQKQVVSLKSSEVCLSIDTEFVGVIFKGNTWKINSEMLRKEYGNSVHLLGHGSVNSQAWPTNIF